LKGKNGTPLIVAANYGYFDICELLLNAGANPLSTDQNGDTLMHFAAKRKKMELVRKLLIHVQLIDARNKKGETPLMYATWGTDEEEAAKVCEILLEAGAELYATAEDGRWAMPYSPGKIRELFESHTALKNKERETRLREQNKENKTCARLRCIIS